LGFQNAVEEKDPVAFEVPIAEMAPGHFSHFAFWGFEMQWKNNPLFLEVPVVEMLK
jgi:hypothetical protein